MSGEYLMLSARALAPRRLGVGRNDICTSAQASAAAARHERTGLFPLPGLDLPASCPTRAGGLSAPQAYASRSADRAASGVVQERFRRQVVAYNTSEAPGTIIIDTPNTYLYYVLGGGRAIRYGIGVGREGFTWAGTQTIARKQEWPDWHPPAEMIARQPYLPRFMAGGPGNPLGARAMYLGNTVYRIHGTNAPHDHRHSACRRAASASPTRTSATCSTASRSAPRSSCCR